MRRISFVLVFFFLIFTGCKKVDKYKNYLQRDVKKVDSVVSMAVDSLTAQPQAPVQKREKTQTITQDKERDLFQGAYSVLIDAISKKDMFLIRQFCYFPDSVFTIGVQGIFQVLSLVPVEDILEHIPQMDTVMNCQLVFSHFPDISQQTNVPKGCFARKITEFHKFTAVIELEQEANLSVAPDIIRKAKEIEPKIDYAVLNTYLGWTFYFIKENGKFYLAAIDYNQY